jgi:transcriptional regulator with XRE-family HTH domain
MSKSIHSPGHLRLRELLTEARKAAGLTREEVAGRLERPQSFVAKYEGGERRIDVVEFIAIVRALGRNPVAARSPPWPPRGSLDAFADAVRHRLTP